jgi:hypothetical protein
MARGSAACSDRLALVVLPGRVAVVAGRFLAARRSVRAQVGEVRDDVQPLLCENCLDFDRTSFAHSELYE